MPPPHSARLASNGPPALRPPEMRAELHALRGDTPRTEVDSGSLPTPAPNLVALLVQAREEAADEPLGPPSSNGPPALRPEDLAAVLARLASAG